MKENILDTLCLSCMKDTGEKFEYCPFCGAAAGVENQFHQLAPKSVLNGRFVVGKTLGQGGFGITYAGYDLTTGDKVAIKEFYPDGGVSRQKDMYTILPYSEKKTEELFTDGRAKFLKEAQKLVKFTNINGIVQVRDYFEENGTAYIVMEYVEGPTLIQYLNKLGQPILPSDLYTLLCPVFDALEQVHAKGILHRDISPDNIIVSPTSAKLLDFGAARDFSLLGEKSNTINIKAGYAPEEQYLTHGKQGPWTDVYALTATCYRAVTGKTPASSIERLSADDLIPPSTLSPNVTPALEQVLLKGMAVRKENRYQSVKEFRDSFSRAVNGASAASPSQPQPVYAANAQPAYNTQQGYTAQQPQRSYAPPQQQGYTAQQPQRSYAPPPPQINTAQQPQNRPPQGYMPPPQNRPPQSYTPQQPQNRSQLNYSSSWNANANKSGAYPNQNRPAAPQQNYANPAAQNGGNKPTMCMIFGIASIVALILFGYIIGSDLLGLGGGIGFGIAALCMGIPAKNKGVKNSKLTAGIVTGIVGLGLTALSILLIIILL
ncbi:MAG: protein kinase [Firmicutes bacterium]|nr:protein kinase [[Eubacterium] siraeum]MCM1487068.1 protein kinase [Bacillota bacterium]